MFKKLLLVLLIAGSATLTAAQAQPPSQPAQSGQPAPARPTRPPVSQDEFVPVNDLPESEKLPAAPYLITAYTVVWVVLLAYVWSLWRRLTRVEQELKQALQQGARE